MQYLLSTYYVIRILPGSRDTVVHKTGVVSAFVELRLKCYHDKNFHPFAMIEFNNQAGSTRGREQM